MSRIILVAVLAVMAAGPASAASFDCKKAKLPVEIAVCSDPTLSSQDEELARQYLPLIKSAPADAAKTIKIEQKAWLAERNACGADMQCIMGSYRIRLQRFGEWRDQLSGAAPTAETPVADPNAPTIDPNAPTIGPAAPTDAAPEGDPTGDPDWWCSRAVVTRPFRRSRRTSRPGIATRRGSATSPNRCNAPVSTRRPCRWT